MFNIFKNNEKAKDPVCGTSVDKNKTQFSSKINEEAYYFCSQNCKEKFGADYKKYLKETSHEKNVAIEKGEYLA